MRVFPMLLRSTQQRACTTHEFTDHVPYLDDVNEPDGEQQWNEMCIKLSCNRLFDGWASFELSLRDGLSFQHVTGQRHFRAHA